MGYLVRQADLEKDMNTMVQILINNRERKDFDYAARFRHVYLNNPAGLAKAWIAWNEEQQLAVGFTGVFPREMYIDGQKKICWNCGDFSIEKKFRSLGIALMLRKAAKDDIDRGEMPFLYAHPNERMEVIHLKAGHFRLAGMTRYAFPLRFYRLLKNKIGRELPASAAAFFLNPLLNLFRLKRSAADLKIQFHPKLNITAEHDRLDQNMAENFRVIGVRNQVYLNWKMGQNPNHQVQQFDIHRAGQLLASVFFEVKNDALFMVDLMVSDFSQNSTLVIEAFKTAVYREFPGINSLSFILQEFNPLVQNLKKCGFSRRSDADSGAIIYANSKNEPELAKIVTNGSNWFMTVGDRDS
jgi:hypothetical protein